VRDEMVTACVSHGRKMNFTKVIIKKPHGTRVILGSRRGWEDYIKMDLRWVNVCWVEVAQDRDHLWRRQRIFRFEKMRGVPWLPENYYIHEVP